MVLLGLETDPSIRPVDVFSSQDRHGKLNDNGMKIRGDHAIALSLIRYSQGHQRGIPLIACLGETFGQSYLETVVGIFGKLVGRIADERQALDAAHDEDARRRVRGPFL